LYGGAMGAVTYTTNIMILFKWMINNLRFPLSDTYERNTERIIQEFLDEFERYVSIRDNTQPKVILIRSFFKKKFGADYKEYMDLIVDQLHDLGEVQYNATQIAYGTELSKYTLQFGLNSDILGYPLKTLLENNYNIDVNRASATVIEAIKEGVGESGIRRLLEPYAKDRAKRMNDTTFRNIINTYYAKQEEIINSELEKGFNNFYYLYVATLDNRTTPICQRNDGMKFHKPYGEIPYKYKPPVHFGCRSRLVFVAKDEYHPIKRASLMYDDEGLGKGEQIDNITYDEWLRLQPPNIVKKILGKTRYELFMKGTPIHKLVNPKTKRYFTVEELKETFKI
jgi:hypothetical protein